MSEQTLKTGSVDVAKAVEVVTNSNNITRYFAILTVGTSTIGAIIAAYQLFFGKVGWLEYSLMIGFYLPTAIGIEAGFHRYFSHNAFRGKPFVTWMLGILGSMAAQGPVLFWAATHRKHHGATDTPEDPHSPRVHGDTLWSRLKGFGWAHMGWLFGGELVSWGKFAPDLLRKRDVVKINQTYIYWVILGLLLPAAIGGLVGGSWSSAFNGFIWGGLARIFLLDHVTWSINSLGHTFGKRPHKTSDNSRNISILSLISVGGSWHNNHHAFPIGARNDHQSRWQIDISGMFIEALGYFGLADNIKRYRETKAGEKS